MTKISILNKEKRVQKQLPFLGDNKKEKLSVTSINFLKNDQPWYPIMGEFHYSRYPEQDWLQEIYKMKSAGLDIIASYVIWIHHEEIKYEWNFSGRNNLRRFIENCQQAGVYFFLRIGPWIHGEVRNGGIPDWLQKKDIKLRSNDPTYLKFVKKYFEQVFLQCEGLFFKDGGPIIGLQIENEYGHAGGLQGEAGKQHMKTLKKMLLEIGFEVPFYTATAWGGAIVLENETLPVFGGYVDAPWSNSIKPLPANENFLISPIFNDPLIASDFNSGGETVSFPADKYPVITAELGGGLQVTKRRRPIAVAEATEAQALVKVASGANFLGYYMFHGGTNPIGKKSTMQESTETGSHTDVPILSYDFQAPLGEYGESHQSYSRLRKLHLFVKSFQQQLALAEPIFPSHLPLEAEDTESLRYNVRHNYDLNGGFLFINNYQPARQMRDHGLVSFTIELKDEMIKTPEINIHDQFYGLFPYNLSIGQTVIKSSNASLLCQLEDMLVFFHPNPEQALIHFAGKVPSYIVISTKEANQALLIDNQLFVTSADQWVANRDHYLSSNQTNVGVTVYPEQKEYHYQFTEAKTSYSFKEFSRTEKYLIYQLNLSCQLTADTDDVFLQISYLGDRAELFNDNEMIADWFTTGLPWRVSLKRFNYPTTLTLKIYRTEKNVFYQNELESGCELSSINLEPIYLKTIEI